MDQSLRELIYHVDVETCRGGRVFRRGVLREEPRNRTWKKQVRALALTCLWDRSQLGMFG